MRKISGLEQRPKVFFLGVNLLGDLLATTPTVRAFRRRDPDAFITYIVQNAEHCRVLEGNPDIDLVLYREDLALHGYEIVTDRWLRGLPIPIDDPSLVHRFDIRALHRSSPDVFRDHVAAGFARMFGVSIDSVRPVLSISPEDRALARRLVARPYVVLGMHATSTVVGADGRQTPKDWVFERWLRVAKHLRSLGPYDVVAVGAEREGRVTSRYFRNLYGLPIKVAAALLEEAECVVTVEGGLSHLCHAVDAPIVLVFSKLVPFDWAFPREAGRCRAIHEDPRLISAGEVIAEMESLMDVTSDRRGARRA